jgi:hypothetical protein
VYRLLPLAALWGALLAATARAEPPAPADAPDAALEKWVEQLGDSDFRLRDEASAALKAAGLKALPVLRRALNHPDAEVRRRVNDLLPGLETAALLAPKRVTASFEKKPLKEVFDEVMKQTGYTVEYGVNDPTRAYSFDFRDATFWEVIDAVSREADLTLQQGYGDDHVRLYQQDGTSPYVCRDGPFRFTALSFQQYRSLDFAVSAKNPGAPRRSENLSLNLQVAVEPKVALLGVGEVRLDAAYDGDHNSLLPPSNPGDPNNPVGARLNGRWVTGRYGQGNRMYGMQTQVNLQRASDKASTVKVVRGTVPLTLLVDQKPVVVTDKVLEAKGKKAQVGTTQIVVEDIAELPGKQYRLKLALTEDLKDNPNDYSWTNSLYGRIELQDEKGGKFQPYQSNWNNTAPGAVQIEFTYGMPGAPKADPPAKLIFQQWTTLEYAASFEFKDLPLP